MQYGSCYGNTGEAPNLNTEVKKMADSRFALSNQNIALSNLKRMRKTKTSWKLHRPGWISGKHGLQTWAAERKLKPKLEEYEHEQLDKMLEIFYTKIRTKDGFDYEPASLKSMVAALDRYLKEHDSCWLAQAVP